MQERLNHNFRRVGWPTAHTNRIRIPAILCSIPDYGIGKFSQNEINTPLQLSLKDIVGICSIHKCNLILSVLIPRAFMIFSRDVKLKSPVCFALLCGKRKSSIRTQWFRVYSVSSEKEFKIVRGVSMPRQQFLGSWRATDQLFKSAFTPHSNS